MIYTHFHTKTQKLMSNMEDKSKTSTTGNGEKKSRLIVSAGGFSAGSGGGIVVAGVIFVGGIIVTAAAAFSFLSRRWRRNRDGRPSSTAIVFAEDDEEEEDWKKFGFEQEMDHNLLRFDLIISSPLRLNHFGEIKETKLVTCIFRNGPLSYASVDDDYSVYAASEDGFFRPPDKKGRLDFSCRNDEKEEFPLLLPNIIQNSFDDDQEIKRLTIPIPNSEVLFQAAPGNPSICHEGDEYATSVEVKEKDQELDEYATSVGAHLVLSEITQGLESILDDQIGQDNGSKLALDDYDLGTVILISEESQENGNQDQMPQNEPKPDLILGPENSCDEEAQAEEKFVKMQQVTHLGKFNDDWISEKGLQNVVDKSRLSSSSLIERYTLNLAKQSERTTNSHRRSVLVFTVLVLSGSLNVWYSSRPLLNLLLMHFRNYMMVKLHLMYRNHGRSHLRFRSVPKMIGI